MLSVVKGRCWFLYAMTLACAISTILPSESTVMDGFMVLIGSAPGCGGGGAQWPPRLQGLCEGASHCPGVLSSGQNVRPACPGQSHEPSARVGVGARFSPCTWMASVTKRTSAVAAAAAGLACVVCAAASARTLASGAAILARVGSTHWGDGS